jgi:ribose 5-phosphate isomerase B
MIIAIAADHRGFSAKEQVKSQIEQLGHKCIDFGVNSKQPADYPDLAYMAADAVSKGHADRAILLSSTGMGMCIAANKVKGIRSVVCYDELSARMSRLYIDANVLCISGELIGQVMLRKIVEIWLATGFEDGRHERRIRKITAIEEGCDPREI